MSGTFLSIAAENMIRRWNPGSIGQSLINSASISVYLTGQLNELAARGGVIKDGFLDKGMPMALCISGRRPITTGRLLCRCGK